MIPVDFKICNYVLANDEIDQVSVINSFEIRVYNCSDTVQVIKPIPLTDEWLIKFGFEKGGDDWHLNGLTLFVDCGGYFYGLRDEGIMDLHVRHVHQLQNLYSILLRKQLTT